MSQFVSESITPLFKGDPALPHVPGEPILPQGFKWRDMEYWIDVKNEQQNR